MGPLHRRRQPHLRAATSTYLTSRCSLRQLLCITDSVVQLVTDTQIKKLLLDPSALRPGVQQHLSSSGPLLLSSLYTLPGHRLPSPKLIAAVSLWGSLVASKMSFLASPDAPSHLLDPVALRPGHHLLPPKIFAAVSQWVSFGPSKIFPQHRRMLPPAKGVGSGCRSSTPTRYSPRVLRPRRMPPPSMTLK